MTPIRSPLPPERRRASALGALRTAVHLGERSPVPIDRLIITVLEDDGCSIEEIAEAAQVTPDHVRSLARRPGE